ncbi:flavin monoamine oxidase family protein [Micromonospora orduensis]|uniref:flavin monoamine oxidase family protein n=1 Tax=Micromonospora orduensis TaxID=1420891 RepID=UPI0033E8FE0A
MSDSDLTRRRFLQAVGISGGAGALFATMGALELAPVHAATPSFRVPRQSDFHLTGRAARKVVILGGGIAGLTAAYELGKAGYDCTVLEARAVTGGRNLTIRGGSVETDLDGHTQRSSFAPGNYLNAGPARIAQWMVTLDYCRELGVPIQPFVNANADALIYNDGSAPIRLRTAKADVYGYVSELLAKATDQGALDSTLTAEDKERLLAFLEDFGDIGEAHDYTGSTRRGFSRYPGAGNDEGAPLPGPPSLSDVFASNVGHYFSGEFGYDQAMMMFQPVGGMDRIAAALTAAVGRHRIRLGARVLGVTGRTSDVTVTFRQGGRNHAITADFCIAALPPNMMAKVPHNLGANVTAALSSGFYPGPAGKIGLEYRSRWWEDDLRIYGGITQTDLDLNQIWYPSYDFHARRGVVVGYYNYGEQAEAYGALTPNARTARAVEQGVKIHGRKYRSELASAFSVAWNRMPYLEGAWAFAQDVNSYELLLQPAGRVYFAGDWLTNAVAWQHGAFLSARTAVTAIHQRVLAT